MMKNAIYLFMMIACHIRMKTRQQRAVAGRTPRYRSRLGQRKLSLYKILFCGILKAIIRVIKAIMSH